ncbi:hypothetical protein [Paenibacillus brevis]|uniref:DUF1269 domain-containing protein n=1 Tax=Paenibacillus brevis TaxID=2841508 RepID=A0ABS6FW84_9BACL|nr:hypothetical protein [Paenibacillus brevis]MBU5674328.1 hypothetical protein [Paenibacillus brevis]
MAKLLVMSLPARQDAVTIIQDILENGVKREALSVLSKTEEALGKVCLETGLPKPLRGDGNHALFHPLIEISSILERKAVNVAAAGAAGRLLGGAEIGCGSDDLITSLEGIGIPIEDAREMEQALLKGSYLLFIEGNEATPWNAIGKLLEEHGQITVYPAS